ITEHRDDVGVLLDLAEQPDRFAMAAAARQFRRLDGVEAAVGGEDQKLRGCFGEECELETVVGLEREARYIGDLTAQRPDPAFLRYDDSNRLALDQRLLDRRLVVLRRHRKCSAAFAERRFRTEGS